MKRTTELVDRAKQLRADGWTLWEIAAELGVSEGTVRNWTDDTAAERNRQRAALYRRPITEDEARLIIAMLAGRRVVAKPSVVCDGTWAGGLNVNTTDGPRHVDEISLPAGLQRRRVHLACRKLHAVAGG